MLVLVTEIHHATSQHHHRQVKAFPLEGSSPRSRAHPHGRLRRLEATLDAEGNGGLSRGVARRGP